MFKYALRMQGRWRGGAHERKKIACKCIHTEKHQSTYGYLLFNVYSRFKMWKERHRMWHVITTDYSTWNMIVVPRLSAHRCSTGYLKTKKVKCGKRLACACYECRQSLIRSTHGVLYFATLTLHHDFFLWGRWEIGNTQRSRNTPEKVLRETYSS